MKSVSFPSLLPLFSCGCRRSFLFDARILKEPPL
ncbi:MAG: GlyGly-CTERM sorting domain-containing protein [Candidatus Manganitrophaceae bacterium]|nr:MAG: GlyGly-CTERM sorting domain-containing protein [Candidatus Manganitrophaceae bacterium]